MAETNSDVVAKQKGNMGGKKAKQEEPVPRSYSKPALVAVVVVILIILAFVISQSGSIASGDSASDEAAALQVFNSFKSLVASHNGAAVIELTTLSFLPNDPEDTELVNFFTAMFSNQSLLFSASNVVAADKSELTPAQQVEPESHIQQMTNQSQTIHIEAAITDYVLITGSMTITGIENPPEIDDLVIVEINGGWYLLLGN